MKRLGLPVARGAETGAPSVDDMRQKLGGRAQAESAGEIVVVTTGGPVEVVGVVVYARGEDVDVLTTGGIVRRTRRESVRRVESTESAPEALLAIANDARIFASLREGDRVRFDELCEGTLVEKCRYGALVARASGALVGVGFRRLWPVGVPS